MADRDVLVDTTALIALSNAQDDLHAQATLVRDSLNESGQKLFVSELVLTEFLNAFSRPPLRACAITMMELLRGSHRVAILPASERLFAAAYDLYRSRPDKSWSLVDCSSIYLCRRHRIRRVFIHDRHFTQAGLTVLLK